MSSRLFRWTRVFICLLALSAFWAALAPQAEAGGGACLMADFVGAPIYDCVCGGHTCYAFCGQPGPNDPCLDEQS